VGTYSLQEIHVEHNNAILQRDSPIILLFRALMPSAMAGKFTNAYDGSIKAEAYSKLTFPNCYYLAYRDLPEIIQKHVRGKEALDFGCGAGRSTRFLASLGFNAVGIDISPEMVRKAKDLDPKGDYRLVKDGDYSQFQPSAFDLLFCAFTFDNIPNHGNRVRMLKSLGDLLRKGGHAILLDSTPEIYWHEWTSFSNKDYPENRLAKSGGEVKIVTTDIEDREPVVDIIWFDDDYRKMFTEANLKLVETYKPLGKIDEPYQWINETKIPPWVIYVLMKP